jgi:hypothetical protein
MGLTLMHVCLDRHEVVNLNRHTWRTDNTLRVTYSTKIRKSDDQLKTEHKMQMGCPSSSQQCQERGTTARDKRAPKRTSTDVQPPCPPANPAREELYNNSCWLRAPVAPQQHQPAVPPLAVSGPHKHSHMSSGNNATLLLFAAPQLGGYQPLPLDPDGSQIPSPAYHTATNCNSRQHHQHPATPAPQLQLPQHLRLTPAWRPPAYLP